MQFQNIIFNQNQNSRHQLSTIGSTPVSNGVSLSHYKIGTTFNIQCSTQEVQSFEELPQMNPVNSLIHKEPQ
ncbi:hypothetical protein FGO68_gene435 [Halteria grandinella]|uniref:Uncharacterized protein n=1 Tax=Halteria grandinella TaxID=5974 RepID=A0A8J8NC88_HALGN|nr:hypothetical protein FGO68_gene435 [Halteria grandinella]